VTLSGSPVELTPTEFRLLVALAGTPDRLHSYADLLHSVWGPEYADDVDFLRVYVWRLRKKLEADPSHPRWLSTERGFGYRFIGHSRRGT
jgi:two-component system KDP operon response regulator KdpE